jgi:hypothetical protein
MCNVCCSPSVNCKSKSFLLFLPLTEVDSQGPDVGKQYRSAIFYADDLRQWNLNWASSRDGTLTQPAIGDFKNGRGEFLDQESFNDRAIFARNSFRTSLRIRAVLNRPSRMTVARPGKRIGS